jgi:hypothetical protein
MLFGSPPPSGLGDERGYDSIGSRESQIFRASSGIEKVPTLEFALDLPGVTQRTLWDFHADPRVLLDLTPPEKDLRMIERPAALGRESRVVVDVLQFGVRLRWISVFAEWEPPARFVDVQEKGPFASWRHEHLFTDGRLVDRVAY